MSDVSTGGVVQSSGALPIQRMKLFYGVCVPLRLFLAYIVYKNIKYTPIQVLVALLSAFAVYSNLLGLNSSNKVWWNRQIHAIVAVAILLSTVAKKTDYVPYIMVFDVVLGVASSVANNPWNVL